MMVVFVLGVFYGQNFYGLARGTECECRIKCWCRIFYHADFVCEKWGSECVGAVTDDADVEPRTGYATRFAKVKVMDSMRSSGLADTTNAKCN